MVEKLDGISLACENRIPEITYVPNDSSYPTQWAHQKIESEAGWEFTRGSDEIIIGIVDLSLIHI